MFMQYFSSPQSTIISPILFPIFKKVLIYTQNKIEYQCLKAIEFHKGDMVSYSGTIIANHKNGKISIIIKIKMFKTALRDNEDLQRCTLTAGPTGRKGKHNPQKSKEPEQQWGNYSTLRPNTTPLASPRFYDTLNSTKESHLIYRRSIDAVYNELQESYRSQMCGYLRRKLKHLVEKRQQDIAFDRYLQSTIQTPEAENTSYSSVGPLDHFYSTFKQKSKLKVEKGVEGAYLSNAKEHIVRLIHRKREQQADFKEINKSVNARRQVKQQRRRHTIKGQFNVPSVKEQKWDQEWRESTSKEKARYRNRLLLRNNRELHTIMLVNFNQ